mgnify:CR=1 FL=1
MNRQIKNKLKRVLERQPYLAMCRLYKMAPKKTGIGLSNQKAIDKLPMISSSSGSGGTILLGYRNCMVWRMRKYLM